MARRHIDNCCWGLSAGRVARLFAKLFDDRSSCRRTACGRSRPTIANTHTSWRRGRSREIDYEPAESTTNMFGGNSNWRGPIWLPLNYVLVSVLDRYQRFFGDEFTLEYPTGSGRHCRRRRSAPTSGSV